MFGVRSSMSIFCAASPQLFLQQTRNTFILKGSGLHHYTRKVAGHRSLKPKNFVYDLVEDTNIVKKSDIKVVLNQFVDGVGHAGDILSLQPTIAYKEYLMPGLAVYANSQNLEKYKVDESKPKVESEFSSPYVQKTMECLSSLVLQISMSKTQPWTLEPWHIRTSFRKAGYVVPEYAITMPPATIKGPDLSLQEKEFFVTVKINNKEQVNVRCRIHHWATGLDRLPWVEAHWKKPCEALFPDQASVLENMPLPN